MGMGRQRGKLDKAGLIQILEVLCEELEKNNLLPGMTQDADAKKEFLEGVADKIEEACGNDLGSLDISFKDDPEGVNNLMNTFKVVLVAEFVTADKKINPNANPDSKLDPKKLLEDKSELKLEELIKDLKEDLHQTITSANKPKPKLSDKDIDKVADVLAEDLAQDMKKMGQTRGSNNKSCIEVAAELTIASLFGGNGPTQSILGNYVGLIDFNPGGGDALNYMAKQNTAEPGKADPTGAEKITLVNAISKGGMSEGLENTLDHIIHPSPTASRK